MSEFDYDFEYDETRYNSEYSSDYGEYFDDGDYAYNNADNNLKSVQAPAPRRKKTRKKPPRQNIMPGRKGLKWELIALYRNKYVRIGVVAAVALIIIICLVSSCAGGEKADENAKPAPVAGPNIPTSYKIDGIPVISQDDLHAGCETYACTMLLQGLGFDIDEYEFVDNYLITRPVYYGDDGNLYGPDMNSAYAGDIYTGWGIYARGMAKCMNNYLKDEKSKLVAYPLENVPLEQLCREYILNGIPVMVWETTYMQEPYVKNTWIVDYADDDSPVKPGDTMSWQQNEHCMVLVGFDEENYIFCDSVAGKLASYDKKTSEKRYEQIGEMAIVVK